MKKIILSFGIIAGLIAGVSMSLGMALGQGSIWLGYLVMFIAFSTIYIAIRQYRDQQLGGIIDLKTGLWVGFGITAVAAVIYALVWDLYLLMSDYQFIDDYAQVIRDSAISNGASEAEANEAVSSFTDTYNNVFKRMPMTMLEILPPGIVVSIFSAALLRNQRSLKSH